MTKEEIKVTWRNIERIVYICTILIGVIFYARDEAKEEATIETEMVNMADDIKEMRSKLNDHDGYWLEQKEVNGAIVTALSLDVE